MLKNMGNQTSLVVGIGLLALLMLPCQLLAWLRMRADIYNGLRELGDVHGREVAGSAATFAFLAYTFISGYVEHHDWAGFRYNAPYRQLYVLAKGLIKTDRTDMAWAYPWIWGALAVVPLCLAYAAINAYVARWLWTKQK